MNKVIINPKGEIINFLNSGDYFYNNMLSLVAGCLTVRIKEDNDFKNNLVKSGIKNASKLKR